MPGVKVHIASSMYLTSYETDMQHNVSLKIGFCIEIRTSYGMVKKMLSYSSAYPFGCPSDREQ